MYIQMRQNSTNSKHWVKKKSLHCTGPFIITLLLSQYDLNNVDRDIKHQNPHLSDMLKCTEVFYADQITSKE